MKFRGDFQHNEYRLGHFYKSDVKNLVGYRNAYPLWLDDSITDAQKFFTFFSGQSDTLFFSVKSEDGFLGYAYFSGIDGSNARVSFVKRPMIRLNFKTLKGILRTLLAFGFGVLKLHKISYVVVKEWEPSRILAQIAGFTLEGELRDAQVIQGRRHNILMFGILEEEF